MSQVELSRRIYGLENEYGVTCTLRGQRRLSPDEVARYLFRKVVVWGRSSNVFLENGGRLYLDVGSHPEFATPECDSVLDAVRFDKAGESIIHDLVSNAEERLAEEGIRGTIYVFKNNTDSAGNSYGCHENYLVKRDGDFENYDETFIPFLVTRQIFTGAGKILNTPKGPMYSIAQRAEHVWEGISTATTRSRPIINTRDEPHADIEKYRRLHVIVGDSNMSEYTTFVKMGSAACVLRMMEHPDFELRNLQLENPIRAIRDISHDITCRKTVRLASGREMSALDIQRIYVDAALKFAEKYGLTSEEERALSMWKHCIETIESDPMNLNREVDWVIKLHVMHQYMERKSVGLDDPSVNVLDLQYHDIDPHRGVFNKLQSRGLVEKLLSEPDIEHAKENAPATTRAHLRGKFVRAAKAKNKDFTVDWIHLKLNDTTQRTVLCKDPFASVDERVERLIETL